MKKLVLGLGLAAAMTMASLPAAADCGDMHSKTSMDTTIHANLEAGGLGPGDIIAFNHPLMLTGTVESHDMGLVHLNLTNGMHAIVPESLAFRQDGMMISSAGLNDGALITAEIPADHNWVINAGPNVPFASRFEGQDVILLGGYDGTIWLPRADLLQADLDFVADSGVMVDMEAAELEDEVDVDLNLETDVDVDLEMDDDGDFDDDMDM